MKKLTSELDCRATPLGVVIAIIFILLLLQHLSGSISAERTFYVLALLSLACGMGKRDCADLPFLFAAISANTILCGTEVALQKYGVESKLPGVLTTSFVTMGFGIYLLRRRGMNSFKLFACILVINAILVTLFFSK